MRTWRTAAYCGLAMVFLCVGARRARAEPAEDDAADAGRVFDNSGDRAQVPVVQGGESENSFSHVGNKLMKSLSKMPQAIKDNAVPLAAGGAIGALVGVGVGSAVPVAGPIIGGLIGAALGAGIGAMLMGDDEGSKFGKVLTAAGAGVVIGMSFGLWFPIIGPVIGGIAGAVIGAAAGLYQTS